MATSDAGVLWAPVQESWFGAFERVAGATPWLHTPARLFAVYGVVLFAAALLLAWWVARRDDGPERVTAALCAPVGVLVAVGVNQLLGTVFAEPRPYAVLPDALVLVARSTDYSFPSDHAVMAGAVAAGVLLVDRTLGLVTAALAVLMAFTRVYVGAHWPLDVAAGLLVGAAVALATYAVARPLVHRAVTALAGTPARPLVTARTPPRRPAGPRPA
ncbi:phosphatase PAP2 family protein [Nocardioides taihuensis]|uniref:Phosphatase PAP2 family protein n=1 Tax=Nocardioides taihuensis TaxID=1835606 RepID=A0ABW0BIN9_9ACTN